MTDELQVGIGFCSAQGSRERNEDYVAAYLGTELQRRRQGMTLTVADGVGGAAGGRVAAELATRTFIEGYYGLPETIGISKAAAASIDAVNRWIFAQGRSDPSLRGMACTLTALILRGRQAHVVHVGDSRLYRLREGRLARLTTDHTLDRPDSRHILLRAVGAEANIRADYAVDAVRRHDRFLLCSDGVHGSLRDAQIGDLLLAHTTPEEASRALVDAALAAGASDNATALIADVIGIPIADDVELSEALANLPILPPPSPGDVVDNFELGDVLANGRYSRLFKAVDRDHQRDVVIKFPKPNVAEDVTLRRATMREIWVASRVRSPWVGEVIELAPQRQSRLYSVMPFYDGETLERRLGHRPKITQASGIQIAVQLAKAVATLHRAGIIHRDIKPDNIIVGPDGGLKLVDLGVVALPKFEDFPAADMPGTPSYMAPELFEGYDATAESDQFALGVTIYRMFSSGPYPYGEIEPFSRPRFGEPTSLLRHRPELPIWLDAVITKAIAVDPAKRFADTIELGFELEHGAVHGQKTWHRRRPLLERNPVRVWQGLAAILAALLLFSLLLR